MKSFKTYINFLKILIFSGLILFSSCLDDVNLQGVAEVPEGKPAVISVSVVIPEMDVISRAAGIDPDSDDAKTITDLWIGIYNIATGKRVGQAYVSSQFLSSEHNEYGTITIKEISTLSGKSRIVAVANGNSQAIHTLNGTVTNTLMEMLQGKEAENWDSFLQIAAALSENDDVMRGSSSSFIMCGAYRMNDEMNHDNIDILEEVDIYPNHDYIFKVHLRRLDAYYKFNISTDENLSFTPVSWQICNLPGISFLFEHTSGLVENDFSLNAADYPVKSNLWNEVNPNSYFHNSQVFGPTEFIPSNNDSQGSTSYSFDFYQFENKHTGIIRNESNKTIDELYFDREKEWKNRDESGKESTNSGWYKSLVNENEIESSTPSSGIGRNNNATYIVIKGRLEYFYSKNDSKCKPIPPPQNPNDGNYIKRVADVTYTVHLGYCEGNGVAKVNDFNVRRNSKYTYNITLQGAEKIRLEAFKEGELQPGAEGNVTDIQDNVVSLDSHYHVVNIALTDKERAELTWRIQAPFDNEIVDMVGGAPIEDFLTDFKDAIIMTRMSKSDYNNYNTSDKHSALFNNQFYNWIQIRPTQGENIIADYPGDPRLIGRKIRNDDEQVQGKYYSTNNIEPYAGEGSVIVHDGWLYPSTKEDQGKGIWYLEQLCNPYKYKWNGEIKSDEYIQYDETLDNTTKRWYTIFIDEYVYEYELDKESNSLTKEYPDQNVGNGVTESGTMDIHNWRTYVNKDDRRLWLSLSNLKISDDKESIYSTSQYYITQESIQTYYSSLAEEAIGLENTNESYKGINQSWNFSDYYIPIPNEVNKFLLGYYVIPPAQEGSKATEIYNYDKLDGLLNQYLFIRYRTTDEYPNIDAANFNPVRWKDILKKSDNSNPLNFRIGESHNHGISTSNVKYYIPDHPDDIMMACLSRNRDLNNDNIIGANEVRWYLPTSTTYTRMVLGTNSLKNPLFNMQEYGRSEIPAGTGKPYSHYAASDRSQLWAEELAATGNLALSGNTAARTLRCIRNIGQPTNLSPNDSRDGYKTVSAAYRINPNDKNVVELIYFKDEALRPYQRDAIPEHDVSSRLSHAPAGFRFAKSDCKPDNLYTYPFDGDSIILKDNGNITFKSTENNDPDLMRTNTWRKQAIANNNLCRNYFEDPNRSDLGTWRLPNISEMSILVFLDSNDWSILGEHNGDETYKRYLTCTREYFNGRGNYFLKATRTDQTITASERETRYFYVRCVKDVR